MLSCMREGRDFKIVKLRSCGYEAADIFQETFLPLALQKTAETSPTGVDQSRFVFEYRANILACNTNKFVFELISTNRFLFLLTICR